MASTDIVLIELRETHATLTTNNLILANGQRVVVSDILYAVRNPSKIGDGSTAYNSLPFDDIVRIETDANYDVTQASFAVDSNEIEIKNIHASAIITITDGGTNVDIDAQESAKLRRRSGTWELYKNNLASDVDANITHRNTNITDIESAHGIQQGTGNGFDSDTLDGLEANEILAATTVYNITTSSNEVHALPDALLTENQQIIKRRGDGTGLVTFTTELSQTIDTEAASLLELFGESSIILIPKSGNWESVRTGGATGSVVGVAGEAITTGDLVYFHTDGKLMIADNTALATSIISGFATNDAILNEAVTVQSSGILEEFTGLTEGSNYFLGNSGTQILRGAIDYSEYIVSIGVAVSTTEIDVKIGLPEPTRNQDDGNPVGSIKYFSTYKDRSSYGYLPFAFDNAISQANYPVLFAEIGHIYNAQHVAAGDTDATILDTLFYPTPIPGYTEKAGVPDSAIIDSTADVDDTTELITLTTADYNSLKLTRGVIGTGADGIPVRVKLVSGALPTGLAEDTTYFVRFKTTPDIELYTDEASAIDTAATTNRVDLTDAVGTFQLTQEGIVLDDAMQGHWHNLYTDNAIMDARDVIATDGTDTSVPAYAGGVLAVNLAKEEIANDTDGTPRTTNETRPKSFISFGYIKAEHVTSAGEPISALRYDTGWIANSDWTNTELTVTHSLTANLSDLIVKLFISTDGTEANSFKVDEGYETGSHFGVTLYNIDTSSFKIQTGSNGVSYINDSGTSVGIASDAYYYKVVVVKPNLINTVFDPTDYSMIPVGGVLPWATDSAPVGYLICDGTAYSRTEYHDLFDVLGTAYGLGDGSTTFNIPDYRGVFLRGAGTHGTMLKADGSAFSGGLIGSELNDAMQQITGTLQVKAQFDAANTGALLGSVASGLRHEGSAASGVRINFDSANSTAQGGSRTGAETRPASVSVNYIIRAKNVSVEVERLNSAVVSDLTVTDTLTLQGDVEVLGDIGSPQVCKAWVNFDGTTNVGGFCTIGDSYNVTSVTDNGTGDYTINFTNAMSDANYSIGGTAGTLSGDTLLCGIKPKELLTTSFRFITITTAGTLADRDIISVQIFGS